jgi:hypothetical protein
MLSKGLSVVANSMVNKAKLFRGFAERSYGGLKDSDRIFTNVYKDGSPFMDGALRRVFGV